MGPFKGTHYGPVTYVAGEALPAFTPVKLGAGGVITKAAATDRAIGVTTDGADTVGDIVAVAVFGAHPGTVAVKAKGAVVAANFIAADGSAAAATGTVIGIALGDAADGDLFEMAHCVAREAAE